MIGLIAVLARDTREFEDWCRSSGLSPRDREVVYISRWDKLRGLDNVKFIRCTRWHEHPEAGQIDEIVRRLEDRRSGRG